MSAPATAPDLPEWLPLRLTESLDNEEPLLLHTPGPMPPVDDDDDDEDDDRKGGGKGGNIDPDDDEDLDDGEDDEDDDDEADRQWALHRNAASSGIGSRFVV